jgi:hypothetical protein
VSQPCASFFLPARFSVLQIAPQIIQKDVKPPAKVKPRIFSAEGAEKMRHRAVLAKGAGVGGARAGTARRGGCPYEEKCRKLRHVRRARRGVPVSFSTGAPSTSLPS